LKYDKTKTALGLAVFKFRIVDMVLNVFTMAAYEDENTERLTIKGTATKT